MIEKNILISAIIPVYNSERTLNELAQRLDIVLKDLVENRYQLLFINDGSLDLSWKILGELASKNEKIIAVNLTRNFGQHNALMCGFSLAEGNYLITLDDDLQNPPEEISKVYKKILKGYDVVYGIYKTKKHSKFRNVGSDLIQFIYHKTFKINVKITSFRIIKKDIVNRMLTYDNSFTFIDGLISWFTDNIGTVEVEHHGRKYGSSGYSFKKLIMLSLNMMSNFSIVPLQVASMIGIAFSITGFSLGLYFLAKKLFFSIPVSGFASIIVAITIFSGVQLLTIGVLGEYIGRIHINVSNRPQYAIREILKLKTGLNKSENKK